jgi:hypothetical protein
MCSLTRQDLADLADGVNLVSPRRTYMPPRPLLAPRAGPGRRPARRGTVPLLRPTQNGNILKLPPPHPTPFSCESFSLVLCRYQGVEHERHIIIQGQSRGKSNLGGPFSRDANSVAMTDCQWNHDNKGQLATHIHHEHMT